MRVILETDNAIVGFDHHKKSLIVLWSSKGIEKEFNQVYNCVLKGFKIYFVNTLVNDIGGFGELNINNINILSKKIIPSLIKCGLRNFISINASISNNQKLKWYFDKINTKQKKKVIFKEASTFEEAFEKIIT